MSDSDIEDIASGVTNSVDTETRTLVDPFESVGRPSDAAATAIGAENSVFALLKGALVGLGVSAGSGTGTVNTSPNVYVDPVATLGDIADTAQTDFSATASAIQITKGVLSLGGL